MAISVVDIKLLDRELIDQKGMIRALKFVLINRHDLEVGKDLIEEFEFENDAVLLMDRGFLTVSGLLIYMRKENPYLLPSKKEF